MNILALFLGCVIGTLGGLIGLGGAEFRLPVLVSIFKLRTLQTIVINLIISLITVIFSFIFRTGLINLEQILSHTPIILNILAGSLIGSYTGVHLATKIDEKALKWIVIVFLVALSGVLIGHEFIFQNHALGVSGLIRVIIGFLSGIVIGIFSSMLGVAGGELIIPTIILLFSIDIKLAGNLSLAISIPTIVIGLLKYKYAEKLKPAQTERVLIVCMSIGSIVGAFIGSYLLRYTTSSLLHILLGAILFISAIKLSMEKEEKEGTRQQEAV